MIRRVTLSDDQIAVVTGILDAYADYLGGDDREDHGLARLQKQRGNLDYKRRVFDSFRKFRELHYRRNKSLTKAFIDEVEKK